ncbi:MAG: hypothetical protein JW719_02925 [Pirellulales bacterium]|nr:hypothetical protein [Pirellulales bacterium]
MIAPLRETTTTSPPSGRLSGAHRYLATALLECSDADRGPAVAPWKAWAMVGWMAFVAACYAGSMLNWW